MDSSDSGIFRLASVGIYLDALASITHEMSLRDRSNLIHLDKSLHRLWGLGANVLVGGSNDQIALQPVSIEGMTGLNVAAGFGQITLKAGAK